jgi:uncharacterized protein
MGVTMNFIIQIGESKALIIPISAWIIAQVFKTIIQSVREKHLNLRFLISAGGMPSAHAALVCALATTMGITNGVESSVFAISIVLAAVVMYDAAGVRQTVDKQSVVLNHLLGNFPKTHYEFEYLLQQLVGHTRFQVVMGAMLGILLAYWWT